MDMEKRNAMENAAKRIIGMEDFCAAVEEIADGFFLENGEYVPHFGEIKAVSTFAIYYFDGEKLTEYFGDAIKIDDLMADKEFMSIYNDFKYEYKGVTDFYTDFSSAYRLAKEIVEQRLKKNAFSGAVDEIMEKILRLTKNVSDKIEEIATPENLALFKEITEAR